MVFFTRIDPAKNIRRFWLATVTPTLLGGWSLVREWGRVGQPGTVKASTFESENEARRAEQQGIRKRERHGYHADQDVVARWAEVMAAGGSIHAPKSRPKSKSKTRRYSEMDKQGRFDFPDT
jgi:predicted DNA-binding WGR domain protein